MPPCPSGTTWNGTQGGFGGLGPPHDYTTEDEFVAAFCTGAPTDPRMVDFTTQDLVAFTYVGGTATPLLQVSSGAYWAQRSGGVCSGTQPGTGLAFYAVPKGTTLNVETCTTTCNCPPNCPP